MAGSHNNHRIAIIGIACRFPKANDAASLWQLLCRGDSAIDTLPAERFGVDDKTIFGGYLPHVDALDAGFFGITPREAVGMDPQQRLLLEVAWEALDDAHIPTASLQGNAGGVFVGLQSSEYETLQANAQ